ncbi:MAG: F0F1 ATP synthase subunit epsilon [Firmicutes bacterium]|nr:F0F1 ATP synthase subunit epsilon [Bacillota bacterium]NMB20809.1 F0F1 ATP synthase subunit epsilon [Bacillota bacterium]
MATFTFEVVTQERTVVSTEVEYVLLPGIDGSFGILAGHQPIMASLSIGLLEFGPLRGKRRKIALGGGFSEMHDNKLTVMAHTAELAEEIDVLRARQAKGRAEERLANRQADLDIARAQIALQKALLRLEVADKD